MEPIKPTARVPPEVLEMILKHLQNDHTALLNLRLISKDIKAFADAILQKKAPSWSPMLEEGLEKFTGTWLSTAEQVDTFINLFGGKPTPFLNKTLLFKPRDMSSGSYYVDERKLFYSKFANLVETFKKDIFHLVYYFNEECNWDHFEEFRRIFKLKKLKSLVLSKQRWDTPEILRVVTRLPERLSQHQRRPFPSKLEELQIFGRDSWCPLLSIISPWAPDGLQELKSLSCRWISPVLDGDLQDYIDLQLNQAESVEILQLGKLTNLKLIYSTAEAIELFGKANLEMNFAPEIKKVHLSIPIDRNEFTQDNGFVSGDLLRDAIRSLAFQANYLEVLELKVDFRLFLFKDPVVRFEQNLKFVRLKHLILNYRMIHMWPNLIDEFKKRMSFLKKLTITVTNCDNGGGTGSHLRAKELYEHLVKNVWDLFPESLEEVCVPFHGWRLRRGEEIHFDN